MFSGILSYIWDQNNRFSIKVRLRKSRYGITYTTIEFLVDLVWNFTNSSIRVSNIYNYRKYPNLVHTKK